MEKKKQGGGKQPTPQQGITQLCKGTTFRSKIQQVQALFLSGNELTAKDINALIGGHFTDARKAISVLRSAPYKMQIKDRRATGQMHKIYWLSTRNKAYTQAELFPAEAKKGGEA